MTPDRDDPILDAMLEEVLGGRMPPDLSARIMQSLAIRGVPRSRVCRSRSLRRFLSARLLPPRRLLPRRMDTWSSR
jgi:hypothetical protein